VPETRDAGVHNGRVSGSVDHNAAIKRIARERLGPLGLIQKGRSRTWFDDHTWFVTMVEFQPFFYGKGSYLNVGASWLWWPEKDFLSFDWGSRLPGYAEAGDATFEAAVEALAEQAAERCLELRAAFADVWMASERLNRIEDRDVDRGWALADAGVAAALAGDASLARRRLDELRGGEVESDWQRDRQRIAEQLAAELDDLVAFRDARVRDIQRARSRERLPELDDSVIAAALETHSDARTGQG
jgi:hypothetical protein